MSGASDPLLATAVRSISDDAELQLAAVSLLEKSAQPDHASAGEAISRWKAIDANRKRPVLKWVFIAVLLGLSAWVWTVAGMEGLTFWRFASVWNAYPDRWDPDFKKNVRKLEACLPGGLTKADRWLLLGDASQSSVSDSRRTLWDQSPDDPAFFMEYILTAYDNRAWEPPLNFLETMTALDPGNSWPIYVAATVKMRNVVKEVQLSQAERHAGVVQSWKILDQKRLDECIASLHEASQQPKFDTYQDKISNLKKELIQVDDHLSFLTAARILWSDANHKALLSVLLPAAAAKSQQLVEQNDRDGLVRLISDVEILNRRVADSEIDRWADDSFCRALYDSIPRLHASCVALGLQEESGRLAESMRVKQVLAKRGHEEDLSRDWFAAHSSWLFFEIRRYYDGTMVPSSDAGKLEPGRMADHELLSRACCLAVWIVFGLMAGFIALNNLRQPRLIKRLAPRIASLLTPVDYVWIMGGGILLPYVYMMFVNRLTPLGGREWSIHGNHYLLPMAQFFAMFLLMVMVPIFLARWRLAKRTAALGLVIPATPWGPRAAGCAALLIPVSGWLAHQEPGLWWYVLLVPLAFWLVVFPVLWLLGNGFRALFARSGSGMPGNAVVSRTLIPTFAAAMLLMASAAIFHKTQEHAWFNRDMTMHSVPGFPAVSPYDYAVAKRIRGDIREVLGMEKSAE